MKNIFVGLVCCLAPFANAENLECENNDQLFEEIIQKKSNTDHINDEKEIQRYTEKYDYSYLFNKNHPGKQFWAAKHLQFAKPSWSENAWISQREYNKRIKAIVKHNATNNSNPYSYEILPPKSNVLTQVGEVCVIPVQAYINVEGEAELKEGEHKNNSEDLMVEAMRIDHIFVRDTKNNQWRVLAFNRDISNKDFQEFFPDLPDQIKNELDDGVVEAQVATEASEE